MDRLSQELFDRIVKLDPASLTENDKIFLNARRSYLTQEQRRIFADVLVKEVEEQAPLSRKELEVKARELGIESPEDKKKFPKNSDLESEIALLEESQA